MKHKFPFIVTLIALALYIYQIGAAPLWYDESGTAWMAELSPERLLAATAADTHPPLYLLIVAGIERVAGAAPTTLRLFSALCIVATLWVMWAISVEIGLSERARRWGLLLLAVCPWHLHYAQEARMYGLFELEIALAVWALLRRQWWAVVLAGGAAFYTHNYALIYWPVLGLWALAREALLPAIPFPGKYPPVVEAPRAQLDHLCIAFALPVVVYLPWAWVLAGQMRAVAAGYWILPVSPGSVTYTLLTWLFAFTLPQWMQPVAAMLVAGLLLWLCINVGRARQQLPLAWLVLAPLTLVVLASVAWKPILLFRGFAPSVPFLFLWLAWALDRLDRPRLIYAALLLAPALVGTALGHYLWNVDFKGATINYADDVAAQWRYGDVMIHANEGTLMELHQSAIGAHFQFILPRCDSPNIGALSFATQNAMGIRALDPETLRWERAWFVWAWPPTVTQCEVNRAQAFLASHPHTLVYAIRNDEFVAANIYLVQR